MGDTKQTQLQAKADFETKARLARPTREILEELAVACATNPSPDNTFQYAFCLSKSDEKTELRYAVTILDGLVRDGYEHQVDCMYGSATALYLLGDYEEARVSFTVHSLKRFTSINLATPLVYQFCSDHAFLQ
jgi:fission 1 protein